MAVHGYITHAAHNRRWTIWLLLGYVLVFELIGAFAAIFVLLIRDHEHTIVSDPVGYAARYAVPIAVIAGLIFWRMYAGHARAVTEALGVRIVTRQDEPRFVDIAEEQCTALGVRLPRFGIIEATEPNALTVGEGPNRGLIAVTRGLLERLDDDELAAVLAHEASHIRQGDTRLLAANHALMRTAVILQMNNPLRFETWRQMIVPLVFPPLLLLMLASSAVTSLSMQLARASRRGLKLGRDYVADAEAIRVTHFPEALISALGKVSGRGAFEGSYRFEAMLFDGIADHVEGSHPPATDRIDAIAELAGELFNPARLRRDTRGPMTATFGRRPRLMAATAYPRDAMGKPLEQPQRNGQDPLLWYFTDNAAFREWHDAAIAWTEWELRERRNILGLKSKLMIPLALTWLALLVVYWPKDGNLSKLATVFNPVGIVDLARQVNSGPFCSGPSYPDGKCRGANGATMMQLHGPSQAQTQTHLQVQPQAQPPAVTGAPAAPRPAPGGFGNPAANDYDPNWRPPNVIHILLFAFVIMLFTRPGLARKFFGRVSGTFQTPAVDLSEFRKFDTDAANASATRPPPNWDVAEPAHPAPPPNWKATQPVRHPPPPNPVSFGRRKG